MVRSSDLCQLATSSEFRWSRVKNEHKANGRASERWAQSFGATIYKLLAGRDEAPEEKKAWLEMANEVIAKTGFPPGYGHDELVNAFNAHNQAVKETIPANQLLVYEVKQGWEPLCDFLGTPVPDEEFPRTNDREEFWDRVNGNI